MTLFTLLIVLALERIVPKTKSFDIAKLAAQYFSYINIKSQRSFATTMLIVAGIPALAVWMLASYLPAVLVFFLYLLVLWVCIACPLTRQAYKHYLQAASRRDLEACFLHAQQFGYKEDDLANVGEHLIFVNYRQFASIIIFYVLLGLPGVVFYSLCYQWYLLQENNNEESDVEESNNEENDNEENDSAHKIQKLMHILDWLPARVTAFGFLLVGHFSRGLPIWLNTLTNKDSSAFEVLAKVAKASEELSSTDNRELQDPLHMVKLAKRNIIFLLMGTALMTLVGIVR